MKLREAVLEFAQTAKGGGQSDAKIALALGLNVHTLRYWRAAQRSRGRLVPVTIAAEHGPQTEIVVECGSLRIRGLDVETLAALIARLG